MGGSTGAETVKRHSSTIDRYRHPAGRGNADHQDKPDERFRDQRARAALLQTVADGEQDHQGRDVVRDGPADQHGGECAEAAVLKPTITLLIAAVISGGIQPSRMNACTARGSSSAPP